MIEVLIVLAILAILVALLLPAVQSAREMARRMTCANNLKQIAIAAHNFADSNGTFPSGKSPYPAEASTLTLLLPYLEQGNAYNSFNLASNVTNSPANFTAQTQEISSFVCPSDSSIGIFNVPNPNPSQLSKYMGRSNYFGNLGAHAWAYESSAGLTKNPTLAGIFAYASTTALASILDGSSNTALFAEIRRGAYPGHDSTDVTILLPNLWGPANPLTNPNNLYPATSCNKASITYTYKGLQYQNGSIATSMYSHTVVPNYQGSDCVRHITFDQAHISARSFHPGGVNVVFADGSVHFISDRITHPVWRALGTRQGGEVIDGMTP